MEPAGKVAPKDIAALIVLALFAFTMFADVRVPLLSLVDLGFHELGHLLTYPLPDIATAMAGSFFQVAVPVGLAVYFFFRQDTAASGICLGWAATSAHDAARYIADAPYEQLELLGGDHDWAFVLFELDLMESVGLFAGLVRAVGWLMLAGGFALVLAPHAKRLLTSGDAR